MLKTARRLVSYWMLPEGIRDVLRRSRQALRDSSNGSDDPQARRARELAAANVALRDTRRGRRCFILATGPSVKRQDLRGLKDELCIGVGFFFLHADARGIDPEFHVMAPNHAPFDFDMIERDLRGVAAHYGPRTSVLYGHRPYEFSILNYLTRDGAAADRPVGVLNYGESAYLGEENAADESLWDIAGRPFQPKTVIYCAIQLAAYLGVTEIYLIGCDHDYLQDVQRTENHFYPEAQGNPNDAGHLAQFTTERWFQEYYTRWRDYRLMRDYLSSRGVRIFNATDGGMLDVFPRVRLADLLAKE